MLFSPGLETAASVWGLREMCLAVGCLSGLVVSCFAVSWLCYSCVKRGGMTLMRGWLWDDRLGSAGLCEEINFF